MSVEKAPYPQNAHGTISVRVEWFARELLGLSKEEVGKTIFDADHITCMGSYVESVFELAKIADAGNDDFGKIIDIGKPYLGKGFDAIPEKTARKLLEILENVMQENNKLK